MAKTVRKLYDLEIDEVSLVDRAANQHAAVAFSKRDEESPMPEIYDANGDEIYEDELEHGDVVYDEAGNEFVFVDEEAAQELGDGSSAELDPNYDDDAAYEGAYGDPELVGKASLPFSGLRTSLRNNSRAGYNFARTGDKKALRGDLDGSSYNKWGYKAGKTAGRFTQTGAAQHISRNANRYALGGAAATGAVGGGSIVAGTSGRRRNGEVGKSLGDQVLQELSKALNESDRDEVIAKAMDAVEKAQASAEEAWHVAKALQEERDMEQYVTLASQYQLPVNPEELGPILKRAAEVLPARDVETLDRIFSSVGERMFDELGYNGVASDSEVMDQVQALALETVGKSDLSHEQAVVALFENNPAAYDEYMREQR